MKAFNVLTIAALIVLACDTAANEDAGDTVELEPAWTYWADRAVSPPAIDGSRVYVGDGGGKLTALDRATGKAEWQTAAAVEFIGGIALGGGRVYAYGGDGILFEQNTHSDMRVMAFDLGSGELAWMTEVDGGGPGFGANGDGVFIVTGTEMLGLDGETGEEIWRYKHATGRLGWLDANASVVAVAGMDGRIVALDAGRGTELWRQALWGRSFSTPLIAGDTVFCGDMFGTLHALALSTGEPRWTYSAGGGFEGDIAFVGEIVCAGSRDAVIHGIDAARGVGQWTRTSGKPATDTSVFSGFTEAFGLVWVTVRGGETLALDPEDGAARYTLRTEGTFAFSAGDENGVYVSPSRKHEVHAYVIGSDSEE